MEQFTQEGWGTTVLKPSSLDFTKMKRQIKWHKKKTKEVLADREASGGMAHPDLREVDERGRRKVWRKQIKKKKKKKKKEKK